jgi:hypothetical protein
MTRGGSARGAGFLALAAASLSIGASPASAGGKPAPPKGPPPLAVVGCEKIAEGRWGILSPDGKRFAFQRWGFSKDRVDKSGELERIAQAWVRDLAAAKDAKQKEWKLTLEAIPCGWSRTGKLFLSSGSAVEWDKGTVVGPIAALPKQVDVEAAAWTADGRKIAYVPGSATQVFRGWNVTTVTRFDSTTTKCAVQVLEVGSDKPVDLPIAVNVMADQTNVLSWSPDGTRLHYDLVASVEGHGFSRRIGVYTVADGSVKQVAEMEETNGIPGLSLGWRFFDSWADVGTPRYGGNVWDAKGSRFVYVHGTGGGDADLYVASADGAEVSRVTDDGETKWSPAMDPAGRRAAFLVGDADSDGKPKRARLRVLDLSTGDSKDFALGREDGNAGSLAWTADGAKVLYDVVGGMSPGCYAQTVPAARAGTPGTLRHLEITEAERVRRALISGREARVEWGVETAKKRWDAAYVAPLRTALHDWAAKDGDAAAIAVLDLLVEHDAKEALPEVREATKAKSAWLASKAIGTLVAWKAIEAMGELDALRLNSASPVVRVRAAGAMAALGDPRGLPDVEKAAKATEPEVRGAVSWALEDVRDPKSVDLLIGLVEDKAMLDAWRPWIHSVGDAAEWGLARLTGRTFGRDKAAWTSWWADEAKRVLPPPVDPNPATDDLMKRWKDAVEKERGR